MKKPPPVTTSQHLKSSNASVADEDDDTPCGCCGQRCNASTPDKQDNDWLKCGTQVWTMDARVVWKVQTSWEMMMMMMSVANAANN